MGKRNKYKPVKSTVDVEDCLRQSITALEEGIALAQAQSNAAALIAGAQVWNNLAVNINIMQQQEASLSDTEISDMRSDTEIVNKVGFSPRKDS